MLARIWDGFQNVVANLGTARDKASASTYGVTLLDYHELLTAYRSSWLPQAIVDIPALDSVRKWRAWQAEAQQITALEAEEKRLNLRERVQEANVAALLAAMDAVRRLWPRRRRGRGDDRRRVWRGSTLLHG